MITSQPQQEIISCPLLLAAPICPSQESRGSHVLTVQQIDIMHTIGLYLPLLTIGSDGMSFILVASNELIEY